MKNRFAETLSSLWSEISGRGVIQRLCAELGWTVDKQDGDSITLIFTDDIADQRNLYISGGDEELIRFRAYSFLMLPAKDAPEQLPAYLLKRNSELMLGKWQCSVDDEGDLMLCVGYCALSDGMDADTLKYIALSLIGEANEFDAKMQKAGFLER